MKKLLSALVLLSVSVFANEVPTVKTISVSGTSIGIIAGDVAYVAEKIECRSIRSLKQAVCTLNDNGTVFTVDFDKEVTFLSSSKSQTVRFSI